MRFWKRTNKDGATTTVESCSHNAPVDGAMEITEKEFNDFIASLPVETEPAPSNSIEQDLQDIKRRVSELETRITAQQ